MHSDKKNNDKITREDALKKMGKYAALTAMGSFIILNPKKSQAASPPDPDTDIEDPGFGF